QPLCERCLQKKIFIETHKYCATRRFPKPPCSNILMPPLNTIKISQLLVRNCRPIVIAVQDATKGNRLGGNPPTGVVPLIVKPWTCYFATLEITDDPPDPPMELSVFLAGGSSVDLLRQCMHLMPANEGPVQL